MRDISRMSYDLEKTFNKLIDKLKDVQQDTAQKIWEDVVMLAPLGSGEYISSIKVGKTEYKNGIIRTKIYTDLKSEEGYYIGRMIENGTGIFALEQHIGHTKTFFESGYMYWYVPTRSVKEAIGTLITINGVNFYVAHAQPSKPHFKPALEKNKQYYRNNISKVMEESKL